MNVQGFVKATLVATVWICFVSMIFAQNPGQGTSPYHTGPGLPKLRALIRGLRDPGIMRVELLNRFHAFAVEFPEYGDTEKADSLVVGHDEVQHCIAVLDTMVHEDEEHSKRKIDSIDGLPVEDQIAELIYQLRDSTEWPDFAPRLPPGSAYRPDGPQGKLFAFGFRAVPQLLDALSNSDFTRSACPVITHILTLPYLPYEERFDALMILSDIAHLNFAPILRYRGPKDDEEWAKAIARARKWWEEVQRKVHRN